MILMPPVVLTHSLPETMQAPRQVGSFTGYSMNEEWPMSYIYSPLRAMIQT